MFDLGLSQQTNTLLSPVFPYVFHAPEGGASLRVPYRFQGIA
ncbi:hypothetical protein AA0120_g8175 [Alternaria tenuissima]|uniref:Uncharacterized protein n=1 Tax=Alternaria tenuissima TaxID=119927 RepID=A0A4Q4MWV7_9PLEO|nr:hypothetical protein AA0114_g562 [Alternaria tenuissima]RYN85863.1 hypothetical protein AA0120_g8175 [Alternaria tenuissima]